MKTIFLVLAMFTCIVVFCASASTAEAYNPAGSEPSAACVKCMADMKTAEGCEAKDIKDPRWDASCVRALVRFAKECTASCQ